MNKKTGYISLIPIIMTVITLLISGCHDKPEIIIDSQEKEAFLGAGSPGLYIGGERAFIYREEAHQRASNESRKQVRIQTNKQDTILNVSIEKYPASIGVHISTSIDYRASGKKMELISLMECSKIEHGKGWFWDPEAKFGLILQIP